MSEITYLLKTQNLTKKAKKLIKK